jgi:hypothetical protein
MKILFTRITTQFSKKKYENPSVVHRRHNLFNGVEEHQRCVHDLQ